MQRGFTELDGFYTFLMATDKEMLLVRDAFACKPAVVAETDDYVAVASEFRSLAHLPGVRARQHLRAAARGDVLMEGVNARGFDLARRRRCAR